MDPITELYLKYADELQTFIEGTKIEPGKEAVIKAFVQERLPVVITTGRNIFADKQVTFPEVFDFVRVTSAAVRDGLNVYSDENNAEKLVVVRELIKFIVNNLFVGDAKQKELLLNDKVLDGLINLVYRFAVKRRIF